MSDPLPAVTDPNKPGTATSEFKLTVIVGAIGAVVAGLSLTLTQLHDVLPQAGWITIALTAVGGLATMLAVANQYIGGRSQVKVAQLQVVAAQLHAEAATTIGLAGVTGAASPSKPSGG